nr:unnamed protein product [Callosobruchus analis]
MVPSEIESVDGYSFYRKGRDGRGGGIGVYISNEIKCEQIIITNYIEDDASVIEQLCLKLQFKYSTVALGILYSPPKDNIIFLWQFKPWIPFYHIYLSFMTIFWYWVLLLITSSTETLLDPIFTTFPERCTNSGTLNTDVFTDHRLVYCETHFEKAHFEKFNHENLTPNLRAIFKQRDDALSKYKQNRIEGNWKAYAELRNFALSCQRREKYAYLQHLQNTKNSSLLFKGMNIQNKKSNDIPAYLRNPEKINEYFLSVFQNNTIECDPEIEYYDNNKFDESFHFDLVMTTEKEIYSLLFKVKSNACGHDGITPDMIKLCFPVIGKYLTHLINTCIEMHYFPFSWRQPVVIPLPKINNPTAYSDLRPISLLPILSKVFEKLVYNQLKQYCFENSIIPVNQSGFKAGNSTTTTLLKVTDDIVRALDKSQAAALVLLDFSKAFDTINHPLLISKCKFFGFSENSIMFLKSYLMNRKQLWTTQTLHSKM